MRGPSIDTPPFETMVAAADKDMDRYDFADELE
jgi:hypothetical protein